MSRVVVAVVLLALLPPVTAQALPINVEVLSATYSTNITFGTSPSVSYYSTTTMSGPAPVTQSASYRQPPVADNLSLSSATATADWLAVYARSSSELLPCPCSYVSSSADFALRFSPLTDGLAELTVNAEHLGPYTDTLATLFDVTAGFELWRLSYSGLTPGGVALWNSALSSTHVYDLHLSVAGDSLRDSTGGRVGVSGLQAVPEPSSLLLLGAGVASIGLFRRARTRRRS